MEANSNLSVSPRATGSKKTSTGRIFLVQMTPLATISDFLGSCPDPQSFFSLTKLLKIDSEPWTIMDMRFKSWVHKYNVIRALWGKHNDFACTPETCTNQISLLHDYQQIWKKWRCHIHHLSAENKLFNAHSAVEVAKCGLLLFGSKASTFTVQQSTSEGS